jgi:hypothetical protein
MAINQVKSHLVEGKVLKSLKYTWQLIMIKSVFINLTTFIMIY